MKNLIELINLCKASVTVSINDHKDYYQSVEEYIKEKEGFNPKFIETIGEDIYQEMIKNDVIIEVQAYPHSPVGFSLIYHHDLEKAIDLMLEVVKKEQ